MAGIFLIMTTFYFQVLSKKIYYLEVGHAVLVAYLLLQSLIAIPESPRFLLAQERYQESKDALEQVANINGVSRYNSKNFIFDAEETIELEADAPPESNRSGKIDPANEYGITSN